MSIMSAVGSTYCECVYVHAQHTLNDTRALLIYYAERERAVRVFVHEKPTDDIINEYAVIHTRMLSKAFSNIFFHCCLSVYAGRSL